MKFLVEGVLNYMKPNSEVRRIGEFDTVEEAIATARRVVDDFLSRSFERGMDAQALLSLYKRQGEYPFIFTDGDKTINVPGFEHSRYARERAAAVCEGE